MGDDKAAHVGASAASALHEEKPHGPETEGRGEHCEQEKPRISGETRRLRHHAPEVCDRDKPEDHSGEHEIDLHCASSEAQSRVRSTCGALADASSAAG